MELNMLYQSKYYNGNDIKLPNKQLTKVVVYGTGTFGALAIYALKQRNIKILYVIDDNFKNSILNFKIDFTGPKPIFIKMKTLESNLSKMDGRKKLLLRCRKESFLNTVYSKSPWEDLSIGFQCKINRHPNEYNYKFLHHFTNNYITSKNVRAISDCSNCEKLTQYLDNQIFI